MVVNRDQQLVKVQRIRDRGVLKTPLFSTVINFQTLTVLEQKNNLVDRMPDLCRELTFQAGWASHFGEGATLGSPTKAILRRGGVISSLKRYCTFLSGILTSSTELMDLNHLGFKN